MLSICERYINDRRIVPTQSTCMGYSVVKLSSRQYTQQLGNSPMSHYRHPTSTAQSDVSLTRHNLLLQLWSDVPLLHFCQREFLQWAWRRGGSRHSKHPHVHPGWKERKPFAALVHNKLHCTGPAWLGSRVSAYMYRESVKTATRVRLLSPLIRITVETLPR